MKKLSIIIPVYNTEPYIDELCAKLAPQLTEEVECVIIDDGSKKPYKNAKFEVIRQKNEGVSSARNRGLEMAKGKYIAFIDSDDLISSDYIETILDAIKDEPDVVYLSWETFGKGWEFKCDLSRMDFPAWNLCVWNRIWKRECIGDVRFNPKKAIAEDADFIHQIKINTVKRINKMLYFYRVDNKNSLTKKFCSGEIDFNRAVFHYKHITKDMQDLLEKVKQINEEGEAIILTEKNEIPELENYAMIMKPQPVYGSYLIGEPLPGFKQIPKPIKTQIAIYIGKALTIGGVETWMYNFVSQMCDLYDIMILYSESMNPTHIFRLSEKVQVYKIMNRPIVCDTLLNMRITDDIPEMIKAKQIIQVCHTCRMKDWKIQKNYDRLVYVSETARKTFEEPGEVIHNMTYTDEKKSLVLVTASRFTFEKGADRMLKLAQALNRSGVPFTWLIFTDRDIKLERGMIKMPPMLNVKPFIKAADYLVQLSDQEAFCYSIIEALELGTPIITTPLEVLKELKFENKKHGFIVPFDMSEIPTKEIYKGLKTFKYYRWDNDPIKEQWKEILGESNPQRTYKKDKPFIKVLITENYGDLELGREIQAGEELIMRRDRARTIMLAGKAIEMREEEP